MFSDVIRSVSIAGSNATSFAVESAKTGAKKVADLTQSGIQFSKVALSRSWEFLTEVAKFLAKELTWLGSLIKQHGTTLVKSIAAFYSAHPIACNYFGLWSLGVLLGALTSAFFAKAQTAAPIAR